MRFRTCSSWLLVPCLALATGFVNLGCLFNAGPYDDASAAGSAGSTSSGTGGSSTNSGGSAGSGGSGASAGSGGNTTGGSAGSGGTTVTTGSGGSGGSSCEADQKVCADVCINVSDPNYGCGASSCTPCDIPNASAMCSDLMCVFGTCKVGFDNCDASVQNGCETNVASDIANCGSCNNACQSGQGCDQGKCIPLCGTKGVPATGYSACLVLNSNTLSVGTFATMTVKIGAPALSGPSDPVDCISPVAASLNNGTDSSVLCPLPGLMSGMSADMALKSYANGDLAAANPPLPFSAFKCANGLDATVDCTAPVRIYKDGVLVATYVSPVMPPFSYAGVGMNAPIQLVYTAQ